MKHSQLTRKTPLKRTPMARGLTGLLGTSSFQRTREKSKPTIKPTPKRLRSRKVAPNAAERAWMDFVALFGCVVCHQIGYPNTPCAVHHIIEGGRRAGHLLTIGLCDPGHHQGSETDAKISRHPNKARFEAAYGTEYELHGYLLYQYEQQSKGKA